MLIVEYRVFLVSPPPQNSYVKSEATPLLSADEKPHSRRFAMSLMHPTLQVLMWCLCITPVWPSTTPDDRKIFAQAPPAESASHVTGPPWKMVENSLEQREVNPDPHLYSYKFTYHDDAGETTFNISLFMSNCKTGVSPTTVAGIYTFHNGTTIVNATVGDISADLLKLEREDTQERMAHHVLRNVRFLARQSNTMLDRGLVCKPLPQTHRRTSIHDELRRRLLSWPETKIVIQEYTTIIVYSVIAAGISGIITGLGASYNLYLENPGHPEAWIGGYGERSVPFNNTASNALLVEKCRSSLEALREFENWQSRLGGLGSDAKIAQYLDDLDLYFRRKNGKPPQFDPDSDEDFPKNDRFQIVLKVFAQNWVAAEQFADHNKIFESNIHEAWSALGMGGWINCAISDTMSKLAYNIHGRDIEDYRIAKLQARNTGIISAITTFCASLSANIIVDLSTRRRMRCVEAFPSTVYIVMMRKALRDWARARARGGSDPLVSTTRSTEMSDLTTTLQSVAPESSTSSQTSTTSARPSDPPSSPPCVSEEDVVVHVREMFGVKLSDAIPDAADVMGNNFREIEMALRNQLNTQGRCLVPDVSLIAI